MYTVARELPLAAVLFAQFQDSYCATCFAEINSNPDTGIVTCDDCAGLSYCSLKCQRKDWRSVHQYECEILRSQNTTTPLTVTMRLCIRILLTAFRGPESSPTFNGAVLEELETNYKEFRSSPTHNQFLSDILTIIRNCGNNVIPKSVENNKVIGIICSVLCNSFSIIDEKRVEPIGSGMFVGLAKHNHSCASTSHVVFEKNQVLLRSSKNEYSKMTTISYVSRMLPTSERRKTIRGVHFITCNCEMCLNEDLDLVGLASRCQTDKCDGFVKGNERCVMCQKKAKINFEQSSHSTLKLLEILENLHKHNNFTIVQEFEFLQKTRAEYIDVLADCNVAILQIDEQIAYCASNLPNVTGIDLEKISSRGCDHFIARLGIGSPEVTRRLYIACRSLSRIEPANRSIASVDIVKLALQSSVISHGEDHSISKFLYNLICI